MKTIGIEAALRWAYCEELPKERALAALRTRGDGVAPGWMALAKAGEVQAVIDTPNIHGVLPDPFALEAPHPDAVAIGAAVDGLADMLVDMPPDWDLFDDEPNADKRMRLGHVARQAMARLTVVDAAGARKLRDGWRWLMLRHAVLGGAPDWRIEPCDVVAVRGANGRPAWYVRQVTGTGRAVREIEVDGWDARRKRPRPGAYQRMRLEPEPCDSVGCRVEHELWRVALDILASDLADTLSTMLVAPCRRPMRPWIDGESPAPTVLADLTERAPTRCWDWRGLRVGLVLAPILPETGRKRGRKVLVAGA